MIVVALLIDLRPHACTAAIAGAQLKVLATNTQKHIRHAAKQCADLQESHAACALPS